MPREGFPLVLGDVTDEPFIHSVHPNCPNAYDIVKSKGRLWVLCQVGKPELPPTKPQEGLPGLAWVVFPQYPLHQLMDAVGLPCSCAANVGGLEFLEQLCVGVGSGVGVVGVAGGEVICTSVPRFVWGVGGG